MRRVEFGIVEERTYVKTLNTWVCVSKVVSGNIIQIESLSGVEFGTFYKLKRDDAKHFFSGLSYYIIAFDLVIYNIEMFILSIYTFSKVIYLNFLFLFFIFYLTLVSFSIIKYFLSICFW